MRMFPNLKKAFDMLKLKLTSVFSVGRVAFRRFKAFLGIIMELPLSDFTAATVSTKGTLKWDADAL